MTCWVCTRPAAGEGRLCARCLRSWSAHSVAHQSTDTRLLAKWAARRARRIALNESPRRTGLADDQFKIIIELILKLPGVPQSLVDWVEVWVLEAMRQDREGRKR